MLSQDGKCEMHLVLSHFYAGRETFWSFLSDQEEDDRLCVEGVYLRLVRLSNRIGRGHGGVPL
jgi:hypothetical protein